MTRSRVLHDNWVDAGRVAWCHHVTEVSPGCWIYTYIYTCPCMKLSYTLIYAALHFAQRFDTSPIRRPPVVFLRFNLVADSRVETDRMGLFSCCAKIGLQRLACVCGRTTTRRESTRNETVDSSRDKIWKHASQRGGERSAPLCDPGSE